MANNIIKRVWNQNTMVRIEELNGMTFQQEDGGHTFQISGIDDQGNAVPLSGTVAGVFLRSDNANVAISGITSEGVASVTLSDECYALPGRFLFTVFVTSGGQKTVVYAATGTVTRTSGDSITPEVESDVVDLINRINEAVATIPADYSDLWASLAPTFSSSTSYAIGDYVTYDGGLYRFTTAHIGTWNSGDVVSVTLGQDIGSEVVAREQAVSAEATARQTADNSILNNIAPLFSESVDYFPGQYVIRNGVLCKFNSAKSAGAWDVTKISEVKLGNDLSKDYYTELQTRDKLLRLSANIFNKDDSDIQTSRYMSGNGWNDSGSDNRLGTTHPIAVRRGVTYRCKRYQNIYGDANSRWVVYVNYPGDMSVDGGSQGTTDPNDSDFMTWTATSDGFVVKSINIQTKEEFMFCEDSLYPASYEGFAELNFPIIGFNNYSIAQQRVINVLDYSPNIFNVDSSELNTTRFATPSGWSSGGGNPQLGTTHPIYVIKGVTYKWKSQYNLYGTNAGYMYRYRYSDDAIYGNFSATIGEDGFATCTPSASDWVVIDLNMYDKGTFMVCESSLYPDTYRAFNKLYFNDYIGVSGTEDILYQKVVVCDGDSIAAATPDNPEGLGGWFGRLQLHYDVSGHNYAVGGGSITYLSSSRHCISRSIDSIYLDYPELDYLIVDGGTNDADLIGQFSGDTPPQNFGTWTEDDYSGNYDDTKFCGAVESMFYKAVNYWPHAHIGYIVAMEMGHNNLASTKNRKRYFDEAVKIAKKWHIPVLNLWENSGADARLTAFYDSSKTNQQNIDAKKFYYDGQHPTSYGYNKMQPMIEAWVKGI
ncbi:MAG: SGNH/GDSL hydrolase family protein [Bacteroidales bacterium]|nr:SGNH/GDSL hydrolase family protein [Bacteroidales bacterium]